MSSDTDLPEPTTPATSGSRRRRSAGRQSGPPAQAAPPPADGAAPAAAGQRDDEPPAPGLDVAGGAAAVTPPEDGEPRDGAAGAPDLGVDDPDAAPPAETDPDALEPDAVDPDAVDPDATDDATGAARHALGAPAERVAAVPSAAPRTRAVPAAPAADGATDGAAEVDAPRPRRRRRPVVPAFSAALSGDAVAPLPTAPGAPDGSAGATVLPAGGIVAEPVAAAASAAPSPTGDALAAAGPAGEDGAVRPRRRRAVAAPLFQAPELTEAPPRARRRPPAGLAADLAEPDSDQLTEPDDDEVTGLDGDALAADDGGDGTGRRRRRRGRRGRGRVEGEPGEDGTDTDAPGRDDEDGSAPAADQGGEDGDDDPARSGTRRRRRRRRGGSGGGEAEPAADDPPNTVVKVREPRARRERAVVDEVRGLSGSTRLEAKRQRRRDGRDTARRRPPIITESEFLARRESVQRTMLVRNQGERTQIVVLEDGVLCEHYVTRASSSSYAGNIYLGKVQNVLPSMEAAFVDIGKGRNAVLYAGEVNYDASALEGKPRKIEQALKSGQSILVQVTKDPIGHKGARLTSQVTLPGRYLVYVPEGSMTGISRKLPDEERARLKDILKRIVPDDAGVIVRTAAEGASEDDLVRDVTRLQEQWTAVKAAYDKAAKASSATLLHAEPDLVVRVVRDLFNEDFAALTVQGDAEWATITDYLSAVAPDLLPRASAWSGDRDIFAAHRVDEQLLKALDRKVHLPSGGSLVIDRTEAMTVIDVNTGRFTGKGGNLEETVTRNNLEAAEEVVRQLRLRDVGGIIVVDFIDMVLESNRDLVMRRLVECLGRDRTKHQVAEVTSLGLVQMTRKRVGSGLLEAYSEPCEHCHGRGVLVHMDGPPAARDGASAPSPTGRPIPRPPARPVPAPPMPGTGDPQAAAGAGTRTGAAAPEALVTDVGAATDAPAAPASGRRRRRASAPAGPAGASPGAPAAADPLPTDAARDEGAPGEAAPASVAASDGEPGPAVDPGPGPEVDGLADPAADGGGPGDAVEVSPSPSTPPLPEDGPAEPDDPVADP